MNNYHFLQNYQSLQNNIMFDELVDLEFATATYCEDDSSAFWNLALTNTNLSQDQLLLIEEHFKKHDRNSTIYFENKPQLESLVKTLLQNKYKFNFEDSWMFYLNKTVSMSNLSKVKKVTNKEGLKVFLSTFDKCYQKNDPQNAYGELGEYLEVAEKSWQKHNESNRMEYFIFYQKDNPIAVSTLTNHRKIGYISNVGSLKSVRGQGFGKLATLFCVSTSIKNKNNHHCLATEEGTYANEFYKRIGFKTIFTAKGYTKK